MDNEIQKLLRRAGFGVSDSDREKYKNKSYPQVVDLLIQELALRAPQTPTDFDPFDDGQCEQIWLKRMMSGQAPLAEKLTLFWHGHFATSNYKVLNARLMWNQMLTFRRLGSGKFQTLLLAVSTDPAMLFWLDNNSNRKSSPNENYAREVMELFCLGEGHYTERDIKEAARGFTGWTCLKGRFCYQPEHHDNGSKSILGQVGRFGGEDVVRIVAHHPRCARHLSERLGLFFTGQTPPTSVVDVMAQQSTTAGKVKVLFLTSWFRKSEPMVKSPVDYLVGALRELDVKDPPEWAPQALAGMGQALFYPPSVKGWDGGLNWLSAGSLVERFLTSHRLAPNTDSLAQKLARPQYQVH
jgi:uncharacterized protein (DUF1800 family)